MNPKSKRERSHPAPEIMRLIAAFGDPSIDERHRAVADLAVYGEPAVAALIRFLAEAQDTDQRWYAAVTLSKIGRPAVIPVIAAMKENTEKEFRRYAAAALGGMGGPAIEPLIDAMGSDDRELKESSRLPCAGSESLRLNPSPAGSRTPMRSSSPARR